MEIFNYSTKDIIEVSFQSGCMSEASITNSDLNTITSKHIVWNKSSIRDSNCNDAVFSHSRIKDCEFSRSSFINTQFYDCQMSDDKMQGLSLIKAKFADSRLKNIIFDSCTMQRAEFTNTIIENSSIKDIEGIYAKVSNTLFINCYFEISYGIGMNGFSSASFENCLFYSCQFSGYPLRGANSTGCTFINCSGEITDDIETKNCCGLPQYPAEESMELKQLKEATDLIKEVSNV